MNDYCNGIAYATGYFANDRKNPYLVVRNLDKWYIDNIAKNTNYVGYESDYNIERDNQTQWTIKAYNIRSIPELDGITNINDFCRSYIEIHGSLDSRLVKNKNDSRTKRLRLRIYGKENIIAFINNTLPVENKKIQYITNSVDKNKYVGKTCAIYYQSKNEIFKILDWLNGSPRNEKIWSFWNAILVS